MPFLSSLLLDDKLLSALSTNIFFELVLYIIHQIKQWQIQRNQDKGNKDPQKYYDYRLKQSSQGANIMKYYEMTVSSPRGQAGQN